MKSSFSIIPIVFCKKKFKKKLLISLFKLQKPLLVFSGMALQNGRTSLEKNNLIVPAENLKTLSHVSKYEDIPAGHTLCWRSNFDVILSSTAEIYLSMLPCWRVMRQQVVKVLQGNISVFVCVWGGAILQYEQYKRTKSTSIQTGKHTLKSNNQSRSFRDRQESPRGSGPKCLWLRPDSRS